MFKIGSVCVKIAGRDAGKTCVVVEEPDGNQVLVEGAVRRRKVNMKHLEPTGDSVKVKKGDSHEAVMKALGLEPRKSRARKATDRPRKTQKKAETPSPRKSKKTEKKSQGSKASQTAKKKTTKKPKEEAPAKVKPKETGKPE